MLEETGGPCRRAGAGGCPEREQGAPASTRRPRQQQLRQLPAAGVGRRRLERRPATGCSVVAESPPCATSTHLPWLFGPSIPHCAPLYPTSPHRQPTSPNWPPRRAPPPCRRIPGPVGTYTRTRRIGRSRSGARLASGPALRFLARAPWCLDDARDRPTARRTGPRSSPARRARPRGGGEVVARVGSCWCCSPSRPRGSRAGDTSTGRAISDAPGGDLDRPGAGRRGHLRGRVSFARWPRMLRSTPTDDESPQSTDRPATWYGYLAVAAVIALAILLVYLLLKSAVQVPLVPATRASPAPAASPPQSARPR